MAKTGLPLPRERTEYAAAQSQANGRSVGCGRCLERCRAISAWCRGGRWRRRGRAASAPARPLPPNSRSKNDGRRRPPPPALPKVPGGIFTGADRAALRPVDGDVGHLALGALQDRQQPGVAAVDVVADLQLAVVVDEGGLVGEVDRDAGREVDVDLRAAEHLLQPLRGVVLVRQRQAEQHLAVFQRVLDPHAAVAVGALVMGEQVLVRRVVLIHQELVREVEADAAERVAVARRLVDADGAVRVLLDLQPDALHRLRVLLQRRQVFVLDDRRRHVPGRIDGDELHLCAEQRRRLARLADHDLGLPDQLAVVHDAQRVVRDVDHHVGLAEVARHPAPALHVGDDDVDGLLALRAVDGVERRLRELAVGLDAVLLLELGDRVGQRLVVVGVAVVPSG